VKIQIKVDVPFSWNLQCPNVKACQHVLAVWWVWINPFNNCVEVALKCYSNRRGHIQHPPRHTSESPHIQNVEKNVILHITLVSGERSIENVVIARKCHFCEHNQ
jgi:hypothetical protein